MANNAVGTQSFATKKHEAKDVKKQLTWAFIGCGGISSIHIPALAKIPEVKIVAGCDIKEDRRKWFTETTGVTAVYEDWKKMLKEVKPDVVDVCTPNGLHCPATIDALKAGCHVITEKPMAMNPEECERMIAAAKKAKKLLCCGFQYRYSPSVEFFKKLQAAGDIGDILYVKVHALRRRGVPNWGVFGQKELQGGGPMIDIGVHIIEAAHYCMGEPKPIAASGNCWTFLGDKPSKVYSCWPNWDYKTYTVEDLAVGQVTFENGALMQIEASFCAHIKKDVFNFEIIGTKGGYDFETSTLYTDHGGAMLDCTPNFLPEFNFRTAFEEKLKNFVSAILKGTPMLTPGEEGCAVQKMIDGIYRSAANHGLEVKID